MKFPIALQLYSVRDDLAADFYGTLKAVKALGYDGVEFAGLFGNSPEQVKAWLSELDIVPVSAHVPFVDMMANPDLIADYRAIGCQYVVIPYLTEEYRPGQEKFSEVIAGAKMLGEKANQLDMKLCYHNHDFEFVKLDGEYALDVLYREVPAELLLTQIDTCWVNVGGEDPAQYLRKYAGRAEVVHLKDFAGQKSERMYALIGIDDGAQGADTGAFEFRPVGYGKQNFPAILAACEDVGAKWVVVEQDQPSMGKTAMECAGMSIEYLKTL